MRPRLEQRRGGGVGAVALLTAAALSLGTALSLQAFRETRHPLQPGQ